ncbi:MAG: pilus assembly protein CpaD [Sphingomonas sp. 28-66-16]|nr:MAG: pilus assembly protein CpaD [Sphingomonas sp. 28-66-16]
MTLRISMIALVAPMLMIGGCEGTKNRGLESVHQPVVARTDYVFDVTTDDGRLAPGELQRVAGWMASLRLAYGDRIAVDDPAGAAPGARGEIGGLVARYGMFLDERAPITAAELTPGTVRVVVSRMTASVPGCPDFSRNDKPNFESHTSSNQGCSINSNLASMVARPEDLVRGQPGGSLSDPATSNKAIETLRKAPNTGAGGLKTESVGGGK